MSQAIRWLRVSYWTGAIVDALAFLEMLFPGALQAALGQSGPEITIELRLAQAFGAPLMIGWTVLLLWADRKPMERRGVLAITICPVIVGLLIRGIVGTQSGVFVGSTAVTAIAVPMALMILFSYSLLLAKRATAVR